MRFKEELHAEKDMPGEARAAAERKMFADLEDSHQAEEGRAMNDDSVIGQNDIVAEAPARDTEHFSEPDAEEVSETEEDYKYARSLGVTMIAVFFYACAALVGGSGLYLLVFDGPDTRVEKFFGFLLLVAIFSLIAAAAMGLWQQKRWGRKTAMVILLLVAVLRFPAGTIIAGPVLIYLARPSMGRCFD